MLKESFQNEACSSIIPQHYNGSYGYQPDSEIQIDQLTGNMIEPRVQKAIETRSDRTKAFAEVFTPSWICNQMNNYADESWFGRKSVFNEEKEQAWVPSESRITFSEDKPWTEYVYSRYLEITCGEAPFIVSRYDAATGDIIPLKNRIGILDRKLRVINENTDNEDDWLLWTTRAFQSVYGYEFQGDNLLIARINLLITFIEYLQNRWNRAPSETELKTIANIIVWNIWQMDGFTNTIPFSQATDEQLDLFCFTEQEDNDCLVFDWRGSKRSVKYRFIGGEIKMKFDFAIGNPPYQGETTGSQKNRMPPIYNEFMEGAYKIANAVELITPARFLFNAGDTPKDWNEKMLNDPHLKVLYYEINASKIFPGTDIKGGIAVTYRNYSQIFGAIETFTSTPELDSILQKIKLKKQASLSCLIFNRGLYRFSQKVYQKYPQVNELLSDSRIFSGAFSRLGFLFLDKKPQDGKDYIGILGLDGRERAIKFIPREYVDEVNSLEKYKVFVPKSNGSGAIGEVLSTPIIGEPLIGHTETFLTIGCFETKLEALNCLNYIKTKFARTALGILKVTQDNPPEKWKYVPLQDFTSNSDINWNVSIKEIDKQLYKKYGLSPEEVEFIEKNVKEMN